MEKLVTYSGTLNSLHFDSGILFLYGSIDHRDYLWLTQKNYVGFHKNYLWRHGSIICYSKCMTNIELDRCVTDIFMPIPEKERTIKRIAKEITNLWRN